jgi:hypothetical protein
MKYNLEKGYCCNFIKVITQQSVRHFEWSYAIPIKYYPRTRTFLLTDCPGFLHKNELPGKYRAEIGFAMEYCPQCGSNFPKDLTEEWYETMEKQFDIKYPSDPDKAHLIPEEYKTDEWWKRRGL